MTSLQTRDVSRYIGFLRFLFITAQFILGILGMAYFIYYLLISLFLFREKVT